MVLEEIFFVAHLLPWMLEENKRSFLEWCRFPLLKMSVSFTLNGEKERKGKERLRADSPLSDSIPLIDGPWSSAEAF